MHDRNTLHLLLFVSVLSVGCEAGNMDFVGRAPPCDTQQVAPLQMNDEGPQRYTGEQLLAAAEQFLGSFDVTWDEARAGVPGTDRFYGTIDNPVSSSWERVCESRRPDAVTPFHRLDVTVHLANADQTVVAEAQAVVVSPDLDQHGPYIFFDGPAELQGDYADLAGPGAGAMTLSVRPRGLMRGDVFEAAAAPLTERPHELFIERPADRVDASGRSALLLCTTPAPCVVPVP